jgi:2',3'-cyclic-nucleotide 2'-phosphodiesterase (5'-nucleotidase family)
VSQAGLAAALPSDSVAVGREVTGAQLRSILNHGLTEWRSAAAGSPNLMQVSSNVQYSFRPTAPKGRRVVRVLVDDPAGGGPFDLAAYKGTITLVLPQALLSTLPR